MIILGIDPGTVLIGYALIRSERPNPQLLEAGTLRIQSRDTSKRLGEIHREISRLITNWSPEVISLEKLFFAKNMKTAMAVSEARGAILLTAALAGITVHEYAPLSIKKVVTGDGSADKRQVQKMVQIIFPPARILPPQDDMFDAIASALCCYLLGGDKRL